VIGTGRTALVSGGGDRYGMEMERRNAGDAAQIIDPL
jgi:hypothetical protein